MSKQKKRDEDNEQILTRGSTGSSPVQDDSNAEVSREEFDKLQAEFSSLQELSGQLEAQLKRAVADYQNLEKRISEGRSELSSWATAELIKKLLPVVDNFNKAIAGASEEEKKSGWYKGVEMGFKQLSQVLSHEGLDEIKADGLFNPETHEAIDMREGEDGKVLEILEKGYTLNGKILRPTKVVVGKNKI